MSNQNLYPVNTYNPVLYFSIYFHSLNKKGNIILLKFHHTIYPILSTYQHFIYYILLFFNFKKKKYEYDVLLIWFKDFIKKIWLVFYQMTSEPFVKVINR
jgi:hypothetical protein